MANNVKYGKAFEYACLKAIADRLDDDEIDYELRDTKPYHTALKYFNKLDDEKQQRYMAAATTAVNQIMPLEPRLENGNGELFLEINPDAAGEGVDGDVRDMICVRCVDGADEWEIGLSCKHNHAALRHPRITQDMNFGNSWLGIPNSQEFLDEIRDVLQTLTEYAEAGVKWKDVATNEREKRQRYYVPILEAYKNEIERLCEEYEDVPARLMSYFFGAKDFYKVIMKESSEITVIEAFNMHNTLGQRMGTLRPIVRIPVTNLPTRLIETAFKTGKGSDTTIILVFDGGWTVSMRLHNKDSVVKLTGLAWDVQLIGLPTGIYVDNRPWND